MRSLTGGSAGLRDAFGQTGSRFGKSCSVLGEPLLANLLGDCAPKAIAAKFGREKYHKRPRNIGDNAGGPGAVAWVDPPAASLNSRVDVVSAATLWLLTPSGTCREGPLLFLQW